MKAVENLCEGFRWTRDLLEETIDDVTDEQLNWNPPRLANPMGATYAHAILFMDAIIQSTIKGEQPLFLTVWEGKTGVSRPQHNATFEWGRNLRVDLPALRDYARAVYDNTEAYLDGLTDTDLDRVLDLSKAGYGSRTVGWVINALVIGHTNNMVGEISVLKGIQGHRGYPL